MLLCNETAEMKFQWGRMLKETQKSFGIFGCLGMNWEVRVGKHTEIKACSFHHSTLGSLWLKESGKIGTFAHKV